MNDWSMLKRLIWQHAINGGGGTQTVSGSVVSFLTSKAAPLQSLSVAVEPVQDLHGYDSPWPAGGGKNLFYYGSNISPTTVNGVTISYDKDTESFSISGENTKTDGAYIHTSLAHNLYEFPTLSIGQTIYLYFNLPLNTYINITYRDENNTNKGFPIIGGAGGSGDWKSASFVVPSDFATLNNVQIGIYKEAGQLSATNVKIAVGTSQFASWSPYSNICPISGWDEVKVQRTGKNLFDKSKAVIGKFINISQQEIANGAKAHSELIPVKPSTAYFMNGFGNSGYFAMLAVDANKQPITWYGGESKDAPFTATTPSNCRYVYLNFNTDQIDTMAFYEGNTNEGYIPYQGDTYTIQLGQTVYGGTLDVTGGKMVVDRAMVDLGTLDWIPAAAGNNIFNAGVLNIKAPATVLDRNKGIISSIYPPSTGIQINANRDDKSMLHAYEDIFIRDTSFADVSSFKTAMSGQQLVYELATPIEIPLTPTQISALQGNNTVWADAGDVTVTYER